MRMRDFCRKWNLRRSAVKVKVKCQQRREDVTYFNLLRHVCGLILMIKEYLCHRIAPFIIDDKHRGEYNRGIANWKTNPSALTTVAEQAQACFRNQKETLDLMEYYRPPVGRGAR